MGFFFFRRCTFAPVWQGLEGAAGGAFCIDWRAHVEMCLINAAPMAVCL